MKTFHSQMTFKALRVSPKGKAQRRQYLLASGVDSENSTLIEEENETSFTRV